jgi:hypothetical protein
VKAFTLPSGGAVHDGVVRRAGIGGIVVLLAASAALPVAASADRPGLTIAGGRRLVTAHVRHQAALTLSAFPGYRTSLLDVGTCRRYHDVIEPHSTAVICRALLLADDESGHPRYGVDGWIFNMSAMAVRRADGSIQLDDYAACEFDYAHDRWRARDEREAFAHARRWLGARRLVRRSCYP